MLAIDSGRPSADRMPQLQARMFSAEAERRRRESSRWSWLPSVRRACREEARARDELDQAHRLEVGVRHGERPFVTERELDARMREITRDLIERQRTRGFGREL